MPVDENPAKTVKFYPSDGGLQTIPVYVRKGILNAGDDDLFFLQLFGADLLHTEALNVTGWLSE